MSIQLDLFPTLGKNLYDRIGYFSGNYRFFYHNEDREVEIKDETNEIYSQTQNQIHLIDSNCKWHADSYDLSFSRKYTIKNTKFLFGKNGITEEDSTIGIAVIWSSKSSNQRGVFFGGEITRNDVRKNFIIEGKYLPGQIRGTLTLKTILYLKRAGSNLVGIFAEKPGSILGVLDSFTVILDGNGSVFPIVEVSEPGKPLWYVVCSWSDPLTDSFAEDNVKLCINKSNNAYKHLNIEDGLRDSHFLKEILASALQTIVLKAISGSFWDEIVKGEDLEDGSIGQAINYFLTTFAWDTSSPEKLAMSIRADFDNRM